MSKLNIPDLMPFYNEVKDYIKNHQGSKGYIDTQNESCDFIYAVVYEDVCSRYDTMYEARVKAVRVAHDQIEIIYELDSPTCRIVWSDDDFKNAKDDEWECIYWSDVVHFIPTLFSIAEAIEEYVEDKFNSLSEHDKGVYADIEAQD